MDLPSAADWSFPVPIAYGLGRIRELASICAVVGMTNPLVVTDRGSVALLGDQLDREQ